MVVDYIIILLSAIAVGMIVGMLNVSKIIYKGPNARKIINQLYINKKNSKIYKLYIVPQKCFK